MSVVFGGKLVPQKSQQNGVDAYDDPNYGIKLLSKREKTLLAELDRTRNEIVSELVTLGPSVSSGNLEDWRSTLSAYESQLANSGSFSDTFGSSGTSRHQSTRKKHRHRNSRRERATGKLTSLGGTTSTLEPLQGRDCTSTALDFLPMISVNPLSSMGSGNPHKGAKSMQTVKLPVLTLPSFRAKVSQTSTPRILVDEADLADNTDSRITGEEAYSRNSCIVLDDLDRYYIQQYLEISNEQMTEILQDLDAILSDGTDEGAWAMRLSVFNAVKGAGFIGGGSSYVSHSIDATSGRTESYMELRSDADTRGSAASVTNESFLGLKRSSTLDKSFKYKGKSKQNRRHNASYRSSKKVKMAWSDNNINDLNSVEALRTELVKSLGHMQQHTADVKHGILHVQEIVSLSNPKAKTFISTMAADQLFAVVKNVGLRQLRRGWDAWKLNIKNQCLITKAFLFRRFQFLRKLAMLLNLYVGRVIGAKFFKWARFCVTMRTQEEMELKTAAVLLVQRVTRGIISRVRVKKLRENQNFTRMHDSLVKIQALFRCKLQNWKYKTYCRNILEDSSARIMQRVVRGHLGRRKASKMRLFQNKELNAILIQTIVRGLLGRKKADEMRLLRLKSEMALRIQIISRGYIARMRVKKMKQDKIENNAAAQIQALIRGTLARMNLHRRREEAAEYQRERNRQAVLIQSIYRGHRARILFRYYMQERYERRALENSNAIILQCFIRRFVARARVRKLKEQQFDTWVTNAMAWKEMWAEDSSSWFYFNEQSEEALWEPPAGGYKKNDGQLVLANGEIIDEPDPTGKKRRGAGEEHLCVECVKRVAIRACEECGDGFCTKCYRTTHANGSRKQHTWKPAGPIDCTECEEELAERWCVSCDEAYCDDCWRKVHSKGKRRFHPFSQVQEDGHIDNRIFTIDGEQVSNYDASFAQNRHEDDQQDESNLDAEVQELYGSMEIKDNVDDDYNNEDFLGEQYYDPDSANDESYEVAAEGVEEEWTQYYDDDGNPYWYNNYSGISQYEDPHY
mmetsp:Transcript_36750/g.68371  ORF Transcript_36750/g.68371 Transcript_36750/m.68371 type:complete len:1025 (+) Transcript_36750:67-3141(+)|eukprot:CAMPEP_0114428534 /NCGR_PEP_ID=MMETSP0103-20121206/8977_1 /TAXON_ID=37642 ORGANISM="Paraphysomonas imperforata, Strain PA2" /NCGR_SAMPLE_ID=MMETSP0103 /ASSEMBLY_ACC=CAM_ASM_000201 /LENGTH=1024 /DNA_ID=CAMNT_0001597757 /DNA_START=153 /DNA_END=3227 /DNA_ORIENTATION=+